MPTLSLDKVNKTVIVTLAEGETITPEQILRDLRKTHKLTFKELRTLTGVSGAKLFKNLYSKKIQPADQFTENMSVTEDNKPIFYMSGIPLSEPVTPDTEAPVVARGEMVGRNITILFTDSNNLNPSQTPSTNAFKVSFNDSKININKVQIVRNSQALTITMASAAKLGDSVSVQYTAPEKGYLQDVENNKVGSFVLDIVNKNGLPEETPPVTNPETPPAEDPETPPEGGE